LKNEKSQHLKWTHSTTYQHIISTHHTNTSYQQHVISIQKVNTESTRCITTSNRNRVSFVLPDMPQPWRALHGCFPCICNSCTGQSSPGQFFGCMCTARPCQ
jgi:hypothetical protein